MNRSLPKNVAVLPALLGLLVWLGGGCASPVKGLFPVQAGQSARTIYVLHRGLHTGLVVKAADIALWAWPQSLEFPGAEYLEVGWGDTQGYRFPLTSGSACRAMFYSKGSVLLVHAFTNTVTAEYAGIASEMISVQLSPRGFDRMCDYIGATYDLDASNRPVPMATAYPGENFLRARGHYWMLNNCNDWTAGALRGAGCPISRRLSVLPGIVMHETRGFGRVMWRNEKVKQGKDARKPQIPPGDLAEVILK